LAYHEITRAPAYHAGEDEEVDSADQEVSRTEHAGHGCHVSKEPVRYE
jgi:F420-dependent methylenetetrahydromethanopterin dehydrogenase